MLIVYGEYKVIKCKKFGNQQTFMAVKMNSLISSFLHMLLIFVLQAQKIYPEELQEVLVYI